MKAKDWLVVAVFTFLTVLFWTAYSAITTLKTSTLAKTDAKYLNDLNPKFDFSVLEKLQNRKP